MIYSPVLPDTKQQEDLDLRALSSHQHFNSSNHSTIQELLTFTETDSSSYAAFLSNFKS